MKPLLEDLTPLGDKIRTTLNRKGMSVFPYFLSFQKCSANDTYHISLIQEVFQQSVFSTPRQQEQQFHDLPAAMGGFPVRGARDMDAGGLGKSV